MEDSALEISVETDVETDVEIGIEIGVKSVFFLWLVWPVFGFGYCVVFRFGGGMVASFLWLLWRFLGGSYCGCSVWFVSI